MNFCALGYFFHLQQNTFINYNMKNLCQMFQQTHFHEMKCKNILIFLILNHENYFSVGNYNYAFIFIIKKLPTSR